MSGVDEKTERLVVRLLDGELTQAEQDELNRTLLRSADARRMLSDYRKNDEIAADVIGSVASGAWTAPVDMAPVDMAPVDTVPVDAAPVRRVRRVGFWSGLTTALAAAAAIAVLFMVPWHTPSTGPVDQPGFVDQPNPAPEMAQSQPTVPTDDGMIYAGTEVPTRGQRRIDLDYIGVVDEARGTLILLEIDRTRSLRLPLADDL